MPRKNVTHKANSTQEKMGVITVEKLTDRQIAEHNDLIRSTAKMSVSSLKLFEIAVSCLDSKNPNQSSNIKINKDSIFEVMGYKSVNRNSWLTKVLIKLQKEAFFSFSFSDEAGFHDVSIAPIGVIRNSHSSKYVEIGFHPEIMPYLIDLRKNFTHYQLNDILSLSSRYAISIYRLLIMNYNQYTYYCNSSLRTPEQLTNYLNPTISLGELRKLLGISKEKYRDFRDFNRRVLQTSIADINEHTAITVQVEKISVSKRITAVKFLITPKESQALPKRTKALVKQPDVNAIADLMSSPYTASLMMASLTDPVKLASDAQYQGMLLDRLYPAYDQFSKKYGKDVLLRHIAYVGQHTQSIPDDLVNYMLTALTDFSEKLNQQELSNNASKPQQRTRKGKRSSINEELPDWAAHPENIKVKKPSPEKLAKIDEILAELDNKK